MGTSKETSGSEINHSVEKFFLNLEAKIRIRLSYMTPDFNAASVTGDSYRLNYYSFILNLMIFNS
jgi:hypothetical protein